MRRFLLASIAILAVCSIALAGRNFANITAVDPEKRTVGYDLTRGKDKQKDVKAKLTKDCVIREGQYRLGKPATTIEGDVLVNGLKNFVFEKVSKDSPLPVTIYTADSDDLDKGIKAGDVIKILVHPKQ